MIPNPYLKNSSPVFAGWTLLVLASVLLLAFSSRLAAEDAPWLWQIGQPDNSNGEFALAPAGSAQFKQDAFFVIGRSDAKRDWPYVHPGPQDSWAGERQHTFSILFGLKTPPTKGLCRLVVGLIDTHSLAAPKLEIHINGREFEQRLPNGAGDESISGHPEKGRPYRFEISFCSDVLRAGGNDIEITTVSGSWILYDWIGMATPAGAELSPVPSAVAVAGVQSIRALCEQDGQASQPVVATLRYCGEAKTATIRIESEASQSLLLTNGEQSVELLVPAVSQETTRQLTIEAGDQVLASRTVHLKPVRKLTVYVLPHSHTDIGYTEIQSAVAEKQVNNLLEGISAARRTAEYPEGARFIWNVEVLWAADLYLHRLSDTQRADFFEAVKKGQVVLNGAYLNELTGLCRPEELIRLFRFSTQVSEQTGVPIDTAMVSDVPGYTWGTVQAMAQAGIKYFSTAPNYFDRIGTIMREWENKPFYWVGPDNKSKVLVWIPFWGYGMSHIYGKLSPKLVDDLSNGLDAREYPYDIAYVRWSGHGDNATPDPAICDFVKDWNSKYTWPHFVISGTSEAFRAFEGRYAARLPIVRGDWTPYWEDGAASSAMETTVNRQNSDRLAQAESVFAMLQPPSAYPTAAFEQAWKNVLLYSEHTWGAYCSVSGPERKETSEQWAVKKDFADEADAQSRDLLQQALKVERGSGASASALDVFNTLSWRRTELVTVPSAMAVIGDRMVDQQGHAVASQRLRSGELVFLATDVPPFAAKRYSVLPGKPYVKVHAKIQRLSLDSGEVRARIDPVSGGIVELTAKGIKENLVDTSEGEALNDYLYLQGDDLKDLKRNGPVTISVGEEGPLVASLVIESEAPGCNCLRREVRVVGGQGYVEVINLVDKARLQAKSYLDKTGKESVNFAFPFDVPDGKLLLDIPLGAMCPESDQMPSACKNWLTVGRWADVSNPERGVTWVTLDAPLIEVGGLTAKLLNSQTNPDVWRKTIARTQKFYSWVMNNHWGTNYRAYQEGPTVFRFILRPHRKSDPAEATRFATGFSQPLLARRAWGQLLEKPVLRVNSADVVVSSFKPSDDGAAWIVRLFAASGQHGSVRLHWGGRQPKAVFFSDTSEKACGKITDGKVQMPGYGLVTLRAEF